MSVEFIHKGKLAIAPGSGFRKNPFDKRPRTLKLLVRELLGRRPASMRFRISRQIVGIDVVRTMRPSDSRQPSIPDVQTKRLDVAPETAGGFVQLHQPRHINIHQLQGELDLSKWRLYRCETSRAALANADFASRATRGQTRTPISAGLAGAEHRFAADRCDVG